ncbi:MAG: hypothetical protein QOF76_593, partial [Solirubrobacteraceae bacterium]|nr:hypothetical protein [Solirubrobacteraceae bacterium]
SVGVIALSACGSSSSDSSSSGGGASPAASSGGSTVKLSADAGGALKFNTTTLTAKAGTVTVEMVNPAGSGVPHAIAVEGNGVDQDGKTVKPGGTSTDTLKLKPGTYTFYCPVPGHEAAGMKGTLTVS